MNKNKTYTKYLGLNVRRKRMYQKKSTFKKVLWSLILLLLLAMGGICYYVYSIQIVSIQDINIKVKQFHQVYLPIEVSAKLRNNSIKKVMVQWENDNLVDAEKEGKFKVAGKVKNYNKPVYSNVEVYIFINAADTTNRRIIIGDTNYGLPEDVFTTRSNGSSGKEKVVWDLSALNITSAGIYKIVGNIQSQLETEVNAECKLQVLSKEEVLNKIVKSNNVSNKEILKADESIKALPNKVLNKILDDGVELKYVNGFIYEPDLFKGSDGTLKAVGVYYPGENVIKVDYNLPSSMLDKYNACYIAAIHEMGHAFDYKRSNGTFPYSDEIEGKNLNMVEGAKIFNTEFSSSKDLRTYFTKSSKEYFAECFAFYFANEALNNLLKDKAPETYKYIEQITN